MMAKLLSAVPPSDAPDEHSGKPSLAEGLGMLRHANEVISMLTSNTAASKIALSQVQRVISAKRASQASSYSEMLKTTKNPLIKWIGKSPTISLVVSAVDKAVGSGIVTDEMLAELSENPELMVHILSDLTTQLTS